MIPLLYSNDDVVVVDKPAGLAVQPGAGISICLVDVVERDYGWKPYLVHRLDRDTAGCLLVARSSHAASEYGRWFSGERENMVKLYRAITFGAPEPAEGEIRESIRSGGIVREASTGYRVLARSGDFALLELRLGTGRMHQIRIHLASAGCPIVGDDKHGDFARNRAAAKEYGAKKLFLWAAALDMEAAGIHARASVPAHFDAFLARANVDFPPLNGGFE